MRAPRVEIRHTCGHVREHRLIPYKKQYKLDQQVQRLSGRPCCACKEAERVACWEAEEN